MNASARLLMGSIIRPGADEAGDTAARLVANWLGHDLVAFEEYLTDDLVVEKELLDPGGPRCFHAQLKRLRDGAGAPLGVLVVLTDITPQKRLARVLREAHSRVEQMVHERTLELELANESLRHHIEDSRRKAESLQKISSAVRQTADHVIITDRMGRIEYVNPAFERLTGYTLIEAAGRTPRLVKSGLMEPEFFKRLWETILAGDVFRGEFINRKKDGGFYHEEKTITPIRDDTGRITHFVSVGRDVTQRRHEEAEREKLITRLTDALGKVRTLHGLLPICSSCKKIRDDKGYWKQIEQYIHEHTDADFSHGLCPECTGRWIEDLNKIAVPPENLPEPGRRD